MAMRMTVFGVGPRLVLIGVPLLPLALIAQHAWPDCFTMTRAPCLAFPIAGTVLIVLGLTLWASGFWRIRRAFAEGRLLTTGAYAVVRNPMYAGVIVLVVPGVALWLRSWSVLLGAVLACGICRVLLRTEERYLAEKFGTEYGAYCARVNALVPFVPRLTRLLRSRTRGAASAVRPSATGKV